MVPIVYLGLRIELAFAQKGFINGALVNPTQTQSDPFSNSHVSQATVDVEGIEIVL
ncbi:hypothetical protein PITCH_A500001 [uncultured Desulfobacterium sp.]|uniref:Uncharacterized protein n=1 Tax=uncultured Desulfobacterium sp. TaxID=201089 RepID=A0A445N0H5_9BACT|nr:hypothetical protein PITCH_A500001 [uncultured Desulfobacterium sp.]